MIEPMDATRIAELRRSLDDELKREAAQHQYLPAQRVSWLAGQLDEYLERWLALCEASDAAIGVLAGSVLFGMVNIAAQKLSEEMNQVRASADLEVAWRRFVQTLAAVPRSTSRADLDDLRTSLRDYRICLDS